MAREYPTVLDLVGHTPLARLQRIVPDGAATVLAKLEYIGPGGSVKDRIGIKLIEAAEREGKLKPGGTIVAPESPESYYSVSDRLAEEIPGAYKPDQYTNRANPEAHYESTGPEIWEQTGGALDALVIAVGTGGTISGAGRYVKEQG